MRTLCFRYPRAAVDGFKMTLAPMIGVLCLFSSLYGRDVDSTGQKPNVLFLISDDLTAEALACYGNTSCQTPHIDQSEGKEVERFFVMFGHRSAMVSRENTMPR
jgi:hypothetical protein